jgi:hypothetical protein
VRGIVILIMAFSMFMVAPIGAPQSKEKTGQAKAADECRRWRAMVDPQVHSASIHPEVANLADAEASFGISCLLVLEGIHRPGRFSGVTRLDVSQLLPQATVGLDALYVISAIYNQKWEHAQGIALVDSKFQLLTPEKGAKSAFPFVKAWYARVKNLGIGKLRAEHDDPLRDSGLKWF